MKTLLTSSLFQVWARSGINAIFELEHSTLEVYDSYFDRIISQVSTKKLELFDYIVIVPDSNTWQVDIKTSMTMKVKQNEPACIWN